MKTSEQMTIDVLARRDKALAENRARRRRITAVGAPCAAALILVSACAIGLTKHRDLTNRTGEKNETSEYIHPVITPPTTEIGADIIMSSTDKIFFNDIDETQFDNSRLKINLDEYTFKPMTAAQLNAYYGVRLTALADIYPDWKIDNAPYGIYTDDGSEVWKQNSITFTSPDGTKSVYVSINKGGLPFDCAVHDGLQKSSIGDKTAELLLRSNGNYFAQFMYNDSGLKIEAEGLSEDEFLDVVRKYLFYPDFSNPNAGNNNIKVLNVGSFNIAAAPDGDHNDFREMTMGELSDFYQVEIDRLSIIHPEWTESHGKLGLYYHEERDEYIASMTNVNIPNTLNYVTDNGGRISVYVQQLKFEPVSAERLTDDKPYTTDKPYTAPKPKTETIYDENGNIIGQTTAGYSPSNNAARTPDEGVSTVNGYEALIYRDANGGFLADLDMRSRVRITAEGLSESEFLEILDEFTA